MDFVISDAYPGVLEGKTEGGLALPLYYFYPISPQRVILLVACGAEHTHIAVSGFEKKVFTKPTLSQDGKSFRIKVQKMYEEDVKRLNKIMIDNATIGIVGLKK